MKSRALPLVALLGLFFQSAYARVGEYALILEDPPLVETTVNSKHVRNAASAGRLARIESTHQRVKSAMADRKLPVLAATQRLVNAVFVAATPDEAAGLRALPGVVAVVEMPPLKHTMDRALQLLRAPAAWDALGGREAAGAGVKIAVIDSGLDLSHPALQDDSLPIPEGFPKGTRLDLPFTSKKVIVARSYRMPGGDETPRDFNGWGTTAAVIAAGAAVTGPSASISGVAPKAYVGNYKIFDINQNFFGSSLVAALEDALLDGMDIALVPFGTLPLYEPLARETQGCSGPSPGFGVPDNACDVYSYAVENAIKAGMTVVVSAGNNGASGDQFPAYNTINTPGIAPSAITVGGAFNVFNRVGIAGEEIPAEVRRIEALFGDGPKPADPLTAPLKDAASAGDALACARLGGDTLTGAVALIRRGDCDFSQKVANAAAAGAVAAIVYRDDGDFVFNPVGLGETSIPAVFIGNSGGTALLSYLGSHSDAQITLDPRFLAEDLFEEIGDDSSRGPSILNGAIKPEVIAPAYDLYAGTQNDDFEGSWYDPTGYTYVFGTSFAAAQVAGAAALVKQANPSFGPARIKSAIVNTAADIRDETGRARVISMGGGRLDVASAIQTQVTADPATLSFGVIGAGAMPLSLTLQLANSGSEAVTLRLSASGTRDANATIEISPDSLDLAAGETKSVTVRLAGSQPNPGIYDGFVKIEGGRVPLRVPYMYLVGDGRPDRYFLVLPGSDVWPAGQSDLLLVFRVTDRYGVPVTDTPVTFRATAGNGRINQADAATDRVGKAAALVTLGSQTGEQQFTAEVGDLRVIFNLEAQ
jgi:subtilisin family serine protease